VGFQESSDTWNAFCENAKPPDPEHREAMWQKTQKELEQRVMGPLKTKVELDRMWGAGNWRAMQRFVVFQMHNGQWRCIDNGKSSLHNEQVELLERIHTTATSVSIALSKRLFELAPNARQFRCTKDMKSAYRQIPIASCHQQFHVVCVWSGNHNCWMFSELRGLAFGLGVSVLQFNRVPVQLVAVARRWLGIPLISFFDDFRALAPQGAEQAVWSGLEWLVKELGWAFDCEKDSPMSEIGPFLGLIEDLSQLPITGTVTLSPKQPFVDKLRSTIMGILDSGQMPTGLARTVQGKLIHFSNACEGRISRGQVHAFKDFIKNEGTKLTAPMRANLLFHLAIIDLAPWRTISFQKLCRNPVVIYTDASCEPGQNGLIVKLCYVLIAEEYKAAGVAKFSDSIFQSFEDRQTFIAHGEAFAPLLALYSEGQFLQNRSILWFIDNLGILSCYCRGSSLVADVGCIIHASLMLQAKLRTVSWYEHVDSKANVADGGSRDSSELTDRLGIPLTPKQLPPWPANVLTAPADVWLKWLS
jgi:hypothetical protein